MKQIILRNGKVLCTTTAPYPKKVIEQMKESGHEVITKRKEGVRDV